VLRIHQDRETRSRHINANQHSFLFARRHMKTHDFLAHHGVGCNPFSEEDAQTDPVFKDHCIESTFHPTWDKIYGNPREPSTAVVLGEKGSGKTAMRLQIARQLDLYNDSHPDRRAFVIHYDDFNPFLDRFRERLAPRRRSRADKVLAEWKLWDHMDAILSLGVTQLVDEIIHSQQDNSPRQTAPPSPAGNANVESPEGREEPIDGAAPTANSNDPVGESSHTGGGRVALDRHQSRDLLLLAACYDQSIAETFTGRWERLRKCLKFSTWTAHLDFVIGAAVTLAATGLGITLLVRLSTEVLSSYWLWIVGGWLLLATGCWLPRFWRSLRRHSLAAGVVRRVRVGNRETGLLRHVLMQFTDSEISEQPLPNRDRTDDRYEMLLKLQGVLKSFGYDGVIVLVDRVDEPHLINGSAELMRDLLWPMLDNKFLKHPGLGVKMMLPIELSRFIDREERDFYQRARLDKQNMIRAFEWTGESLFDIANARLQACVETDAQPTIEVLFDDGVTNSRLLEAFRSLRVPRRLFKFLYRLLVNHCNAHTDDAPVYKISPHLFESTLAIELRDQDAFDRGVGAGG
jgi:hypothetical protein